MHAAWTRLRRYVAGAMLVAMASFVLHGGAMAGMHRHGPAPVADCGSHASAKGHTHSAAHHHHHVADHAHADDGGGAHAHGDHHGGDQKSASSEPCCGNMCFVAISAPAPETGWAPVASPLVPMPDATGRPDNRPEGLKRPPRTPGIA